eukprot:jgi/Undpi1/9072/HiC_scaffold_26.g11532.m1
MLFWLLDNLRIGPEDTVWIGMQQELRGAKYDIEARIRKEYPSLDLRIVSIDFQTRGAVETLFIMLQHMSPGEVKRKSISLDCDTIYFTDVLGTFRACESGCGFSFYFQDEGEQPIFSYICLEPGTNNILDIQEKVAISRHANTGAYAFPCGEQLRGFCRNVLDGSVGSTGEYYTSVIIERMIRDGHKFVGVHVPSFACVGTPSQLRRFLDEVRTGVVVPRYKARVIFDLDRSLITVNSGGAADEPVSVRPVKRNVLLLQEMKAAGHYTVAETRRVKLEKKEPHGNCALSGPGGLTLKTLKEMGIDCDEMVFGKSPAADVCSDGRTGDAHAEDMEKEIGWCVQEPDDEENTARIGQEFIIPRHFNRITCLDDKHIVKSAPIEYLRGELHFYRSIPAELTGLFPKLIEANDDPSLALPSITITKIDGVSFSHLVTNHCVTRGRFFKLLDGLARIHAAVRSPNATADKPVDVKGEGAIAPACEPIEQAVATARPPKDRPPSVMCANLYQKVKHRLHFNEAAYLGFDGIDVPRMSKTILSYLRDYQESARYRRADFVHGDPVFSNCLLNKANDPVFIDMRGALGDTVCTDGDVNYDLSKVYQSLKGYDFIILDKDLDKTATEMLRDLEESVFWPFVREHYKDALPQDIAMMTASHLLSIVPLHQNRRHQARFLEACQNILSKQGQPLD